MPPAHQRRCYKEAEFIGRIKRALGVDVHPVRCWVVDEEGMAKVMGRSGWARNQSNGVVGFQVGNDVYVLGSAPWTVLHELIHRAGVNADRLNRFVAEGLTEAIATELKQGPDEHRETYPEETAWVRDRLLPALRMSAVQLGRELARSADPPRRLAQLMVRARPGLNEEKLVRELQPQRPSAPSFNVRITRASAPRSARTDDSSLAIAGVMIAGGVALLLPRIFRIWE